MSVKKGDKIKVEYTGTLEDGTLFDSSEAHGQPLEFEVGSGQLIKGFDDAVIGMEIGEEKEIKLQPSEAYGEHNPELVKKVPKEQFPKEKELKPGMILLIKLPNEIQVPVRIAEVTDDEIALDLNHPLAGKVLIFKIKVVEICS
jgi:peptidylprolyl isomerase